MIAHQPAVAPTSAAASARTARPVGNHIAHSGRADSQPNTNELPGKAVDMATNTSGMLAMLMTA
jgi:hypothetical protein